MKLCKVCSSELKKIEHESEKRFQNKKYCSAKCARKDFKLNKRGWWKAEFDQRFDKEVTTYEY